jgi:hypothetical protein
MKGIDSLVGSDPDQFKYEPKRKENTKPQGVVVHRIPH